MGGPHAPLPLHQTTESVLLLAFHFCLRWVSCCLTCSGCHGAVTAIYSAVSILRAKNYSCHTQKWCHREKTVRKPRWQQPPPRNICHGVFVILLSPAFSHSLAFDLVFFHPKIFHILICFFLLYSKSYQLCQEPSCNHYPISSNTLLYTNGPIHIVVYHTTFFQYPFSPKLLLLY